MRTKSGQAVNSDRPDADERAAVAEVVRRDEELSSGKIIGCTHEEVMKAARHALETQPRSG